MSALRAALVSGSSLLAAACSPIDLYVPLADFDAESIVAALIDPERGELIALSAQPAGVAISVTIQQQSADLYLLGYAAPLGELGLEPGGVQSATNRPCSLLEPMPRRHASISVGADRDPRLEAAPQIPIAVFDRLVPDRDSRCGPCRTLKEHRVEVPNSIDDRLSGASGWLTNGAAFSFGGSARPFLVERSRVTPVTGCAGAYRNAHPGGDDRFWLSRPGGVDLVRFSTHSSSCAIERSVPLGANTGDVVWLDGSDPQERFELFTLTSTGSLDRFDGSSWTHLTTLRAHPSTPSGDDRGGITRLGAGAVLAAFGAAELVMWRADQGAVTIRVPVTELRAGAGTLARIASGKTFVGTTDGLLYEVSEGGALTFLAAPGTLTDIGRIAPYSGGILAMAGAIEVFRFRIPGGLCPTAHEIVGSRNNSRQLLVSADDAVLLPDLFSTDPARNNQVLWLTP
ncbi:MAG: hypothetical protein IT384_04620 [Deltaproteobacteria bacterium]|nr:hypothetical protein [Deltaproteobacteria bacterium]